MAEPKPELDTSASERLVSKIRQLLLSGPAPDDLQQLKQRRLMIIALAMLLVALALVLYRDRDFWFPGTQETDIQEQPAVVPAQQIPVIAQAEPTSSRPAARKKSRTRSMPSATPAQPEADAPPMSATLQRTVLPPLEVEVVAGDAHRTLLPGSNSVRVELQSPQRTAEPTAEPPAQPSDSATSITDVAAERVEMSPDTDAVVTQSVQPNYPLLARQMKVQGSVILQALIGRDGVIEDLRVLSGPPILASAARDAVRQWHFKPHYQGADAVETQAVITVNFTISTN